MKPIQAVCSFADLKRLEVINLNDGSVMGTVRTSSQKHCVSDLAQ